MAEKASETNFEKSLEKLQKTVAALESGKLSLEDSLKAFEEGVRLTRHCQEYLQKAEQRVQKLTKVNANGDAELERFESQNPN